MGKDGQIVSKIYWDWNRQKCSFFQKKIALGDVDIDNNVNIVSNIEDSNIWRVFCERNDCEYFIGYKKMKNVICIPSSQIEWVSKKCWRY